MSNFEPGTMEYWRDAYWRLWNGCGHHLEIRMPGGTLDEIVGFGGFHVEQMDRNRWYFELGRLAFFVGGKKVELRPRDWDTWPAAQRHLMQSPE